jgi:CRP/FNR family cyclic AMP-dependent transcriptional regulator
MVTVTYTRSWPIDKPSPGVDARAGAQSAKLAIARRVEVLGRVPLFAGLSKRQQQAVARACSTHRWPADSLIVAEGSSDQYCYVIVEGAVDVLRREHLVARLGPGEFFGEIELLDPGGRSATVKTSTEVVAVGLSRAAFLDVAGSDPSILLRMLQSLARRVRDTTEKLY